MQSCHCSQTLMTRLLDNCIYIEFLVKRFCTIVIPRERFYIFFPPRYYMTPGHLYRKVYSSYQCSVQCNYCLPSFGGNVLLENAWYTLGLRLPSPWCLTFSHRLTDSLRFSLALSLPVHHLRTILQLCCLQVLNFCMQHHYTFILFLYSIIESPQS